MAVQQRRNSKTRKAKRRTHFKLTAPTLVKCPACGEYSCRIAFAPAVPTTANKTKRRYRKRFPVSFFILVDKLKIIQLN